MLKKIAIISFPLALCALAALKYPQVTMKNENVFWFSILPPLVAVTLAILTRKLFLSLVSAILLGGVLSGVATGEGVFQGVATGFGYYLESAGDIYNFQILLFVLLMMALISLMVSNGGLKGVVAILAARAKSARSAQFYTFLMGFILFIDDYANTLIVGSSMRPLSDHYRVSREKLAFIVDATAAPITGIALVSTWIGYVVGLFGDASKSLGLGVEGYELFVEILPYRFYCVLMLVFVVLNIFLKREFGPMAKAEEKARELGTASGGDGDWSKKMTDAAPARVALVPLVFLISFLFFGLWIDGGGMKMIQEQGLSVLLFPSSWKTALIASENNILILALGAGSALFVGLVVTFLWAPMSRKQLLFVFKKGLRSAVVPCLILLSAWSLKLACDGLSTGPYLIATIGNVFSPAWYPATIFGLSAAIAFSTGTSWATMAILIPIALPIAYGLDGELMGLCTLLTLGAILDGSILGDHCSPISDTTVMSSIGADCDHLEHVRTQLPYALFVGVFAVLFGYLFVGFGGGAGTGLGLALIAMAAAYWFLTQRSRGKLGAARLRAQSL